jgi:hypothetical protein
MKVILPGEDTTTTQAPADATPGLLNIALCIGIPIALAIMGNSFLEIIET